MFTLGNIMAVWVILSVFIFAFFMCALILGARADERDANTDDPGPGL